MSIQKDEFKKLLKEAENLDFDGDVYDYFKSALNKSKELIKHKNAKKLFPCYGDWVTENNTTSVRVSVSEDDLSKATIFVDNKEVCSLPKDALAGLRELLNTAGLFTDKNLYWNFRF